MEMMADALLRLLFEFNPKFFQFSIDLADLFGSFTTPLFRI